MRALDFLLEMQHGDVVPSEPGTAPIPPGAVRLYHQTTEPALKSIMRSGLSIQYARGIEGPRAIYASERGFYGKPDSMPTVEFYVDASMWDNPFVLEDVPPQQIIAGHLPWHSKARYLLTHPKSMSSALMGEFDDLDGDYATAVEYVKRTHGGQQQDITELFEPQSAFSLEWDTSMGPREIHAEAHDRQGRTLTISFVPSGGADLDVVDIEFARGGSHGITGKGDASMVLGTVMEAIKSYLMRHHRPAYITFLGKEGSRRGVYAALVNRMSSSMGYRPVDMRNLPPEFEGFFLSPEGVFLLKNTELDESWKSKAAVVGLSTAMALGGLGKYMSDKDPTTAPITTQTTTPPPVVKKAAEPEKKKTPAEMREQVLRAAATKSGMKDTELNQFMAQAAHESMDFKRLTEIGSDKYLANRYDMKHSPVRAKLLGNTKPGDGIRYKGRGYLQITGKYNYEKAGKALGLDLVNHPELLEDPETTALVSIWYWNTRVKPKVADFGDVKQVTKHINPGLKGLGDRVKKFARLNKDVTP